MPTLAVRSAISQQEKITPALLDLLKVIVDAPDKVNLDNKGNLIGMYLLSKFREKRAFPYIIQIASFSEEWTESYFGDVVSEGLSSFLVSTYNGDLQKIKSLIENSSASIWCRSAALSSLLGLLAMQHISREELIDYHRSLINSPLIENPDFATFTAYNAYCLYPKELYNDLMNLFDRNLIDETYFGGKKEVDEQIARGLEKCLKKEVYNYKFHLPIVDVEEDISWLYRPDDEEVSNEKIFSHKSGTQ